MDIPGRYKSKTKKSIQNPKPKTAKKRKGDGPTCSMFLAELTRKLRNKQEDSPSKNNSSKNIVQSIMESLTHALPIKFSKKSSPVILPPSPTRIETLQTFAPELIPNDQYNILAKTCEDDISVEISNTNTSLSFKIPKMPVINSSVMKQALEKKKNTSKHDQAVNTSIELDVASEIRKHVGTLRKISLIAEEFNQKTAKNLKEIIDSVQEDLIKKLEEAQVEQAEKDRVSSLKSILTENDKLGEERISESIIIEPSAIQP